MIIDKNTADFFSKNGYCIVKNVISPELRDFVTQYTLFDEMQDFSPEGPYTQVENAHSKYADPAMESMLLILHPLMEKYTGLDLFPTYSYYRVYRNGDDLAIHKDRPSCEISATICFNYSYNDKEFNWPIIMKGCEVNQSPGDMVIYRGCELFHWRDILKYTEEVWHVQGFFHFVDKNGPYADYKFDKRDTIGQTDSRNNKISKNYITYL
jgi:hypothetical protein